MENEKILVTSALPYANGKIHLGHLSGAYLPADIYVRYHRLKGSDVVYICGSDEHGVPITITADKEKVTPKDIIDRYHTLNKLAFEKFGMSFDVYSRTSLDIHHETAKEFFLSYYDQGLLVEKKSMQFYDEKAGMFLPDRYVEGTCPSCGYEEARSDECEKCGAIYDPTELKNPKSKISGETPVLRETSHWFFPLQKFQKRLEDYIQVMDKDHNWKENVLQYCRSWFREGLRERAITRDLDWGVRVPLEDSKMKVLYVWFEAVLGYISAAKELSGKKEEPELWKKYWQDKNTKYVAFIGKDNVVFHTIIFPALLMAWNDEHPEEQFVLPQNVPANEFLNFEGQKFSKSRGWGIDVDEFLEMFPADSLRYSLATNLPETKDSDFYWKDFQARNNGELADILGNFINRTFIFASKHFEGKVPEITKTEPIDDEMLGALRTYPEKIGGLIERYKIREAVFEMMNLARAGNKYFNDSEPWVSVKQDKEKCAATINICLQTAYALANLFSPVIPFSSEKMLKMLNMEKTSWNKAGESNLQAGHQLNKSEILFTKIDDEIIEAQVNRLPKIEEKEAKPEKPAEVTIDQFFETVLTAGEIIEAESIPKSKKLLKLKVDIGFEKRQVVAGIALSYKPEELPGKKIILVSNLQPAKLFGIESQGMILAGDSGDGKIKLVEPDKTIKNGTRIK